MVNSYLMMGRTLLGAGENGREDLGNDATLVHAPGGRIGSGAPLRLGREGARLVSEGLTGRLEVDRVVQATT